MSKTHLLPASLTEALAEMDLTVADWETMTDEERNELGLTIAEHSDAYADCTDEEMAALANWQPPEFLRRMLAEAS